MYYLKVILLLFPLYLWAEFPINSILAVRTNHGKVFKCEAFIIAERYIVIPEHCIDLENIKQYTIENPKYQKVEIKKYLNTEGKYINYILCKVKTKFDLSDIISFDVNEFPITQNLLEGTSHHTYEIDPLTLLKNNDIYYINRTIRLNDKEEDFFYYINLWFMIDTLNIGDGESELIGMNFVEAPVLSNAKATEYEKELITRKWIKKGEDLISIPFKENKQKIYCCGNKYDLIKIYNKRYDPKFILQGIELWCKYRIECMSILGHKYHDHLAYVYRSMEDKKLMIIDPAISDIPFELNEAGLKRYLIEGYQKTDIVYLVFQNNFIYNSFYSMINQIDYSESDYDYIYQTSISYFDLTKDH